MNDNPTPSEWAKYFYVSAVDGRRKYLLAGPYDTHAEAARNVATVKAIALDQDVTGRAAFMGFGTAGSDIPLKSALGVI